MIYLALRDSGTSPTQPGAVVYATKADVCAAINALLPIADDITVLIQGGHSFGNVDTQTNMAGGALNGFTILWTTDPGEIATPGILLGRWRIQYSGGGNWNVTHLKIGTNQCLITSWGSEICKVEDVLCYVGSTPFIAVNGDSLLHTVNECSVFVGNNTNQFNVFSEAASGQVSNLLICGFLDGSNFIYRSGMSGAAADSITVFNYGTDAVTDYSTVPTTNLIKDVNPNLVDQVIQSAGDSVATMMARDARPTASSTPILNNANPLTATATDIVGKIRG